MFRAWHGGVALWAGHVVARWSCLSPSRCPDPWRGMAQPLSLTSAQIHDGSRRRRWPTSTGPHGSCLPRCGSRAPTSVGSADPWRGDPHPRRRRPAPVRGGGRIQLPPSFAQHGGVDPGQRRWPRIQGREGGHAVAQHGGADLARWLRQRRTQRDPAWEAGAFFIFFKKCLPSVFFFTRQSLRRLSDKKHSAKQRLPINRLPSVVCRV